MVSPAGSYGLSSAGKDVSSWACSSPSLFWTRSLVSIFPQAVATEPKGSSECLPSEGTDSGCEHCARLEMACGLLLQAQEVLGTASMSPML